MVIAERKKKCRILAVWSFIIAFALYLFTYFLFHFLGPDGRFIPVHQETCAKPFVTLLFGIMAVLFHFSGMMSLLIGKIFFSENKP